VHKVTNQERAIKIISKAGTPKHEIDKLKSEINILKNLVYPYFAYH